WICHPLGGQKARAGSSLWLERQESRAATVTPCPVLQSVRTLSSRHAVCGAPGSQLKNSLSFQSEGWAFTRNLSLPGICKRRNLRAQSARRGSPRFARIDSLDLFFSRLSVNIWETSDCVARRILQGLQESMAQRWCRVARSCHIAGIRGCRLGNR